MKIIDLLKKYKDKVLHFLGCAIGVLISVPMLWRAEVEGMLDVAES